ncbi:hypothetical protein AB0L75_16345 [Streptomyces sp. NPDC052101]|uniref:hypothetical protein n=1 Tax=Streptomyces sp. NPDC052101 TaxID=3155763 RepID=UPI00342F3575
MSMMQRYMDDVATVRGQAAGAASWGQPVARVAAVTKAFRACGELADKYHHPQMVAELLVHEVAQTYITSRCLLREAVAA